MTALAIDQHLLKILTGMALFGKVAHMHEAVLDYWPLHAMCIEIDPCHTIARNVGSIVTSPEALFLIGDLQLGMSAHGDNLVMILDLGS